MEIFFRTFEKCEARTNSAANEPRITNFFTHFLPSKVLGQSLHVLL